MNPGDVDPSKTGFGDPSQNDSPIKTGRSSDISRIVQMGKGFLESAVPSSNVVLDGDFAKYIPLFNAEAIKKMGEEKIAELYREYRGRFSLQHPIKIVIRQEAGPTDIGAYYPPDDANYKVVKVLPPMYHRVKTLNDLGPRVCALMDAFFNTSTTNDVQMKAKNTMYAKAIAEAIHKVNSQDDKDATLKEFIDLEAAVNASNPEEPGSQEEEAPRAEQEPEEQQDNKTQESSSPMSDGTVDWF